MREVGRVVGEAAAEEVEEQDPAALFLDEGVGDLGQGDARGADAVDKDDLVAGQGAPFVDPDGAILEWLLVWEPQQKDTGRSDWRLDISGARKVVGLVLELGELFRRERGQEGAEW